MRLIWPKTVLFWNVRHVSCYLYLRKAWINVIKTVPCLSGCLILTLVFCFDIFCDFWCQGLGSAGYLLFLPDTELIFSTYNNPATSQQPFLALRHNCVHEWERSAIQLYPLCLSSPSVCGGVHSQVPNSLKASLLCNHILYTVVKEIELNHSRMFFACCLIFQFISSWCF